VKTMARLGLLGAILLVSPLQSPGFASNSSACSLPDGCVAGFSETEEENIQVKLLQVNVELGRTSDAREHPAGRRSLAERLREGWQRKFLPVTTSILLPHGFAFVIAQFLIRRHRNKKAECFTDPQEDAPRSLPYIAGRVGPMWLIHALSVFVYAVSAPSADYMYLNSFAKHYADGHPTDCSTAMDTMPCSRAVVDVTQIQVIRGFALPIIQFFAGPALGAISDAFGRRPGVILIRIAFAISTGTGAVVAWFDLSVWIDFWIGFLGMIPFLPVPLAWYIDRIDHTPSLVIATALIESSCTLASILGSLLGGFLSLKVAMLIGFLGKLVCLLLALFVLPESLPEEKRIRFTWSSLLPTAALRVLFQSPLVEKLTAIAVIDSFHYNGFYTMMNRFFQQHLAFTRQEMYLQAMLAQFSDMVWLTLGVSALWPILGQVGILVSSTLATALSDVLLMMAGKSWQVNLNCLILGGLGNMNSCVIAGIAGRAASPEKQAMFQSALNLAIQVSSALGPAAFMTVYQLCDPTAPGAPRWRMSVYVLYGVMFAVPSLMLSFALRRFIQEEKDHDSGFSS